MNDDDLELLESYLDDELTTRQLESLRQRLSVEPQLTAALGELRSQREVRQQFFAACEPDQASVERLIRSAKREATREVLTAPRRTSVGWASGLAACLVFGFVIGRGLHSAAPVARAPSSNVPSGAITSPPGVQPTEVANDNRIQFDGPRVGVNAGLPAGSVDFSLRNRGLANVTSIDPFPGDRIFIVDQNGRLVQRFDSHEQYMKFVEQKLHSATQPLVP